jgi:hypothetical protein
MRVWRTKEPVEVTPGVWTEVQFHTVPSSGDPEHLPELLAELDLGEPMELTFTHEPWPTEGWLVVADERPWWQRLVDRMLGRRAGTEVYPVEVEWDR